MDTAPMYATSRSGTLLFPNKLPAYVGCNWYETLDRAMSASYFNAYKRNLGQPTHYSASSHQGGAYHPVVTE